MKFTLSKIGSVTFTAEVSFAFPDRFSSGKEVALEQLQIINVHARRPGYIYIENITPLPEYKPGMMYGTNPFNIFVSDGKKQHEYTREGHIYVSDIAAKELHAIQSRFGLTVLIGTDTLFADDPLSGYKEEGRVLAKGSDDLVLSRIVEIMNKSWKQILLISSKTGLPVRLSLFKIDSGSEMEIRRTTYLNWILNPDIPEDIFDFLPPANAKSMDKFSRILNKAGKRRKTNKPKFRSDQ